jgi:hypothetical protein
LQIGVVLEARGADAALAVDDPMPGHFGAIGQAVQRPAHGPRTTGAAQHSCNLSVGGDLAFGNHRDQTIDLLKNVHVNSTEAVSRQDADNPLQADNGKGSFDLSRQFMPGPGAQQPAQDMGRSEVELSVGPIEKSVKLLGCHREGHVRRGLVIQDGGQI